MRIGFVLGVDGFAAVLYTRTTEDSTARSPWTSDVDLATSWGTRWADRLQVPCDVVRGINVVSARGGAMTPEQRDALTRFVAKYEQNYAPLSPGQRLTLDALRAAHVEPPAVSAWKPIATAPDGEAVLAFFPDAEEDHQIMKVWRLEYDGDPDGPQWWPVDQDNASPIAIDPSHWMPVPQGPTEGAK